MDQYLFLLNALDVFLVFGMIFCVSINFGIMIGMVAQHPAGKFLLVRKGRPDGQIPRRL
jgi:hypothetical protein